MQSTMTFNFKKGKHTEVRSAKEEAERLIRKALENYGGVYEIKDIGYTFEDESIVKAVAVVEYGVRSL